MILRKGSIIMRVKNVIRKFRRIYWYQRDRGKGKKFIVFVTVVILSFSSVAGLGVRKIALHTMKPRNAVRHEVKHSKVASGQAISGSVIESTEADEDDETEETVEENTKKTEIVVDTSGMKNFLGFMSEEAYANVVSQIEEKCKAANITTAKKLDFQETGTTDFDVISYILLGNDKVCKCSYNLKNCAVSIEDTSLTTVDVEKMQIKKKAEEEAKLKAEHEKVRKEKARKSKKKKAKKKKAKKSSKRKRKKKRR